MFRLIDALTAGYRDLLVRWVEGVARRAILVAASIALISIGFVYFVVERVSINTDSTDMLSAELPFRQNSIALSKAFPQFSDNILVVLEGRNPDLLEDGVDRLVAALRQQPKMFGSVFYPPGEPFFRRHQLLYVDSQELADVVDRLAAAQPLLGTLWRSPNLQSLFDLIGKSLTETNEIAQNSRDATVTAIDAIASVVEAQVAGQRKVLSWQELMTGSAFSKSDLRRFILLQPPLDFTSFTPGGSAMEALRGIASEIGLSDKFGVRMRLTGSVPLALEELQSVSEGLGLAAFISIILVLGLLSWGMKSLRLVVATLITLVLGLVWTAGFAIAAVGTLNLISVAFAVLFIGLSVDFGIHYGLRYKEACAAGTPSIPALGLAAQSVGNAITLTAVTAAIGFFAFLPTDYRGLAELGLIAGVGMFIALAFNLTLLPALLALMPLRSTDAPSAKAAISPAWTLQRRFPKIVIVAAAIAGVAAAALSPCARFDFDPLNLKNRSTESVATIFDLMDDARATPYSMSVLAANLETADRLSAALARDPTVDGTATLTDFIPKDQIAKLELIENASLLLSAVFAAPPAGTSAESAAKRQALEKILRQLIAAAGDPALSPKLRAAAGRLESAIAAFEVKFRGARKNIDQLESRVLGSLPPRLKQLRDSLSVDRAITADDLPASIQARQIAADGRARLQVYPRENLRDREALERFVAAVRRVAPAATGAPVVILEAGRAVVSAFMLAAAVAAAAVILLLLMLLRRLRDVLFVILPLLLAGLFSVAATVLLSLSLNFANVIVLPLLFGLGVASAIHLLARERGAAVDSDLLQTSTPRAIVFSALTTIGSFASMGLSSHPGTSSMGVLLTLAIVFTMLSTLLVLPAMLKLWPAAGTQPAPPSGN